MLATDDLRFFSIVARSPTLAAAARTLGVSAPAVSQRLRALEERLRVRLVDRSTRHLGLTEEGRLLATRGDLVLDDLDRLSEQLAERRATVSGHLRVAASFGFGVRYVAPVVARFRQAHPAATVELVLSENPSRTGTESWDVMIHVGPLRDSRLVMRHLAVNRRILCASPEYLRRRGAPAAPADLARHECIGLRENDEDATLWTFTPDVGEPASVRIAPAMTSNNGEVVHAWALAGLGIVARSEWDVADDLRAGRLVEVLPEWGLPAADVTALTSGRFARTARARRFLALLADSLTPLPWR